MGTFSAQKTEEVVNERTPTYKKKKVAQWKKPRLHLQSGGPLNQNQTIGWLQKAKNGQGLKFQLLIQQGFWQILQKSADPKI